MSDIDVEVEQLHTHAKSVEGLAARVDNCANTARGIDFGINTFGIIGQAFAAVIRPFSQARAGDLNSAAEAVRGVSGKLDQTADIYHTTDSDNANLFDNVKEGA
ncbi:MAG: hypothetical protein JOZ47_19990 [Kutzneria sp.]|nr:hypothetical protein [Kutzneria sp.]MBV9847326.1 hypothetical protein [Kutzneria sp.]